MGFLSKLIDSIFKKSSNETTKLLIQESRDLITATETTKLLIQESRDLITDTEQSSIPSNEINTLHTKIDNLSEMKDMTPELGLCIYEFKQDGSFERKVTEALYLGNFDAIVTIVDRREIRKLTLEQFALFLAIFEEISPIKTDIKFIKDVTFYLLKMILNFDGHDLNKNEWDEYGGLHKLDIDLGWPIVISELRWVIGKILRNRGFKCVLTENYKSAIVGL